MSETEKLRAMLDARGIEHSDEESASRHVTIWYDDVHRAVEAIEVMHSNCGLTVHVYRMTSEQAIEATLGRETCHMITDEGAQHWWSCDACNCDGYSQVLPSYCPWCGRKVER